MALTPAGKRDCGFLELLSKLWRAGAEPDAPQAEVGGTAPVPVPD